MRYSADVSRLPVPLALVWLAVAVPVFAGEMLSPGDLFPSWSAVNQEGRTVSSADYAASPYLVWFYPKAMTAG